MAGDLDGPRRVTRADISAVVALLPMMMVRE